MADDEGIPFVAVGTGEDPPWGNDRSCPMCGQPDLPLHDSNPTGLTYITHCGQAWLRGPIRMRSNMGGHRDEDPA